jgi:tetratricopeptide (TPR) repeat protein
MLRPAALLALSLFAAPATAQTLKELCPDAQKYINTNQLPSAYMSIEECLTKYPNDRTLVLAALDIAEERDNIDNIVAQCLKLIEIDPTSARAYLKLGMIYYNSYDYFSAAHYYKKLVEVEPEVTMYHTYLGDAYKAYGNYSDAILSYKEAVRLSNNMPLDRYRLAICYDYAEQYDKSIELLKGLTEDDHADIDYWNSLGVVQRRKGDHAGAIKTFKEALKLEPNNRHVMGQLAQTHFIAKQKKEGEKVVQQILKQGKNDAAVLSVVGHAYYDGGMYKESIPHYQQLVKLDVGNADYRRWLGDAYDNSGESAKALEEYRIGIQLDPSNAQLHYDMGVAYRALSHTDSAVMAFEAAIQIQQAHTDSRLALVSIYQTQGDTERELTHRLALVDLSPRNAQRWYDLGDLLVRMKDKERVNAVIDELGGMDPSLAEKLRQAAAGL